MLLSNFHGNNPASFLAEYAVVVPEIFAPLVDRYGYALNADETWNYEYRSERLSLFVELDRTVVDVLFVPAPVPSIYRRHRYMGGLIQRQNPGFTSKRDRPPKLHEFRTFVQFAFDEMMENLEPLVGGDLSMWPDD